MSLHGTDLAADLNQLLLLGRVDLPLLQYTYATLNNTLAGGPPGSAFTPVPAVGSDQAGGEWTSAAGYLQNVFAQTADTLGATAQMILHVAALYEATDNAARDAIAGVWADGPPQQDALHQELPLPGPVPPRRLHHRLNATRKRRTLVADTDGIKVPYTYRSEADLQGMGQQVFEAAVHATLHTTDDYGRAQQEVINYQVQQQTGTQPHLPGPYTTPTQGSLDDFDNVRRFATAKYADIPSYFTAFAIPDPDDDEPVADTWRRVANTLVPKMVEAQGTTADAVGVFGGSGHNLLISEFVDNLIDIRMKSWHGPAAEKFIDYLRHFSTVATYQCTYAAFLAITLESQLEIKRRMLTDVWTLGEKTVKRLRSLEGICPTKGGAAMTFTVVGALAATVLSDGVAAPLIAAAGGLGSALSTGGPYTKKQVLGGGTVPEVLGLMHDQMQVIVADVTAEQRDLLRQVTTLTSWADSHSDLLTPLLPFGGLDLATAGIGQLDNNDQGLFWDR